MLGGAGGVGSAPPPPPQAVIRNTAIDDAKPRLLDHGTPRAARPARLHLRSPVGRGDRMRKRPSWGRLELGRLRRGRIFHCEAVLVPSPWDRRRVSPASGREGSLPLSHGV